MSEQTLNLQTLPKPEAYRQLEQHIRAVLEGLPDDEICGMATIACLVHHAFGHLWTGFYRVATPGHLLRVGPYQGTLGCLEIPYTRGVCGAAATTQVTQIVPDVHAYPGHITCDGRSASEIVLPVFDRQQALIAVFDIDSEHPGTFDAIDQLHLERILGWFRGA